jgi:beta-glucosidase
MVNRIVIGACAGILAMAAAARAGEEEFDRKIEALLERMTIEEKAGQLVQIDARRRLPPEHEIEDRAMIAAGRVGSFLNVQGVAKANELQKLAREQTRLGIPLLYGFDVIHGYRTIFPIPLAETASWDPDGIERSARIAAVEARASGIHWTFAPMVDIARDPRWGRIAEGAGEDTFLGAVVAAARVRGFQGTSVSSDDSVAACAKHYVAYGAAEAGRDYNTVDVSERTLATFICRLSTRRFNPAWRRS